MERDTFFADVIVPLNVPNKYTYRIPVSLNGQIQPGMRVLVQFGKLKIYTGIVAHVHQQAPKEYTAKYIESVLDESPVVNELQLKFWDWISTYYFAHPGDVMNAALPSGLKLSSDSHIVLNPEFNFEEAAHSTFTEREHLVLDALHVRPNQGFDELATLLNVKSAQPVVHHLLKKNAVLIYEEVKEKYKPKMQSFVRIVSEYIDEAAFSRLLFSLEKKAFKQAETLLYYTQLKKEGFADESGWLLKSVMLKRIESQAIQALVKKGILEEQDVRVDRITTIKRSRAAFELSPQQEDALRKIHDAFAAKKAVLLHGVTGSGKTEIYIRLMQDVLARGEQVLYLVPEIAISTQLIARLASVFGEQAAVYHSKFSESERVEVYHHVLDAEARENSQKCCLILGARSALFLPFSKLGLIVIDEEHDTSFKQHDPAPRYHARDAALYLASLHHADILMGTATPSAETYFHSESGKYAAVKLHRQFEERGGTDVEICDTVIFEKSQSMKAGLVPPLFQAIQSALAKKEQVILFQNRRGFAPYTECRRCGHVPHCVQCDVSLIYHKHKEKLVCHYCGYAVNVPKQCAACGSNELRFRGAGTEKVEEDLEILFPKAGIARMDLDSTRSKYAYRQLIEDFEEGKTDILIGTQMVTKGLDFRNVSVVGVLNADSALNFPDFRSFERAFQLITQVRGRAGRSKKRGKLFVQTTQPVHKVLAHIAGNDVEGFYRDLLTERKQFQFPPFVRLISIDVLSKEPNESHHLASTLGDLLKKNTALQILGPEPPIVARIRNMYYQRLLLKVPRTAPVISMRKTIADALDELKEAHRKWNYLVKVDVDPA
jgi:primosomal protein N' (replication factor Y)